MSKKQLSIIISILVAVFVYAEKLISPVLVVPDTQLSAVVQTQENTIQATTTIESVPESDVYYSVSRVVDGDTIEVIKDKKKEKVRLIGVNTPETVDPRKKVECFGKEASAQAKEILMGQNVTLVSDDSQTKYDKYGRLLAYVYREDGLFVNKHMIAEGYAYEYTYKVPYLFQKEFKEAQKQAVTEGKGLWKAGVCE